MPLFRKEINLNAVSSYLSFRYPTEDDKTFYSGIKRVPAGNIFKIDFNGRDSFSYWKIPFPSSENNFNEKYYIEKLENILNDSVKGQLMSDVPLGVFLSGGLDSSLLSAIATKYIGKNLNTYSVTLQEEGYDESSKAKLVSSYLGTNHHEVILKKSNFLENLGNLIEIKGVPASIPHEFALYLLSKEMKKKISVVLSGEGADEFFGGYARVQKSPFDYFKNKFLSKLNLNIKEKSPQSFHDFILERYSWFSPSEKNKLLNSDFKNQIYKNSANSEWKTILSESSLKDSTIRFYLCFKKSI